MYSGVQMRRIILGLLSAMSASVTGMAAQANYLATVSENISNSTTVGYKQADTQFQDLVDQAGVVGDYTADGVTTSVRYNVSEQGNLTGTTSTTDLAIKGNGFFLVKDTSGDIFLTRAGSFLPDGSGNLVNSAGYTLMGYNLASGGAGVSMAFATSTIAQNNGGTRLEPKDDYRLAQPAHVRGHPAQEPARPLDIHSIDYTVTESIAGPEAGYAMHRPGAPLNPAKAPRQRISKARAMF
jgi:flagellar hook-basal body protein